MAISVHVKLRLEVEKLEWMEVYFNFVVPMCESNFYHDGLHFAY